MGIVVACLHDALNLIGSASYKQCVVVQKYTAAFRRDIQDTIGIIVSSRLAWTT